MINATHDSAVHLLTDHQRFVRLVVQREIKGPLEMPQSPRSPLLKSSAVPPMVGHYHNSLEPKPEISENIIETHQKSNAKSSPIVSEYNSNVHSVSAGIPKTNGIEKKIAQPIPAPRRLTSESSSTNGIGGEYGNSSYGVKPDDEEPQVSFEFFLFFFYNF